MPDLPLGRIQRVDARAAWAHEAHDFTPWLADDENFAALAETLHFFDAEVEATEEAVGDFSADIIARDRDGLILIENQLAQTDHTHLGQILTYLAGFDEPARVVWISTKVREEHRAAVDWLNAHTPSEFSFFAVEMELFQIDDGPVAPHYHVVAKPNEWSRHLSARGRQLATEAVGGVRQIYRDLWVGLNDHLVEHVKGYRSRQGLPQSWITFPIGRAGFHLTTVASVRDGFIGVEFYCQRDPDKVGFEKLSAQKERVEADVGHTLTWERLDGKLGWRVIIRRPVDVEDREKWPEHYDWFREMLDAFDGAFRERVSALDLDAEPEDGPETA